MGFVSWFRFSKSVVLPALLPFRGKGLYFFLHFVESENDATYSLQIKEDLYKVEESHRERS